MKVLHVMSHFPCPPDNGARADIWARLQAMNRLGYSVHALVIAQKVPPNERHVAEMRGLVSSLRFVERRPLRKCLATITPTFISRNFSLSEVPLTGQYDLTLMETEDTVPICDNPSLKTNLRVLRVHNDEIAYLWKFAKAEENFLRRQFFRLEALRMILYSRSAHSRMDSLWFISQSECQRFITDYPKAAAEAVWLPPSIELEDRPTLSPVYCKRVLFVGNFYTSLNREGLRWYLDQVHPILARDPDYDLVVAGSTQERPAAKSFAEELRRETRCAVHVDLEDTKSLYQNCAVFINPMRGGAGVKLKSVHAIGRGLPVVSTSVGNEGSGFADKEHVRLADTPAEFASAVTDLLDDSGAREQLVLRAYKQLNKLYNCEANIRRLITNLVPRSSQCLAESAIPVSAELRQP
jgi:glycosyltransferase involved in cell wall biosynthesis